MPINPINPLIPLQAQAPDLGATFSNVLLNIKNLDQIRQGRAEAPTRQRLLEAQTGAAEQAASEQVKSDRFKSVVMGALDINRQPDDQSKLKAAKRRRDDLLEQQKTNPNINTVDTDEYIAKLEAGDTEGAQALIDNTIAAGQRVGILEQGAGSAGAGLDEVKSSKILDGGAVQIVTKGGDTRILEPTDEEKEVIRRAEERGVDIQQRRAQGRGLGAGTAKIADKAFDQTGKIRANILSLRKVIKEVGEGAETGPLAAKFPSFKAASVRLDRLKNQLGLDVVGSVTFGALSEGELNLALNTALPTTLEGPELVQWATDKIQAQEKLAGYLEDQAIFLSRPGNSAGDWLLKVKSGATNQQPAPTQTQPAQAAVPQVIKFDALGNIVQ
jgi:hypothetical protein